MLLGNSNEEINKIETIVANAPVKPIIHLKSFDISLELMLYKNKIPYGIDNKIKVNLTPNSGIKK